MSFNHVILPQSVRKYDAATLRSRFLRPAPAVPAEQCYAERRRTSASSLARELFPCRRGKRSRLSRTAFASFFASAGATTNSPVAAPTSALES